MTHLPASFLRLTRFAVLAALLSGCASGYQSFYQPAPGATPERIASLRLAPAPAQPQIERTTGNADDGFYKAYLRRGYAAIGVSSFNSGRPESEASAVNQARAVGADLVVIVNPTHAGSTTTHIPITMPTATTSQTYGTATAYSGGRAVTAVGNATTTTYGSTTNMIPITVNRTNYAAIYFIKRRMPLGVSLRPMTDAERGQLQSNKGLVVRAVLNDSSAFHADVLDGDILLAIDDQAVTGIESLEPIIAANMGKTVRFKLNRSGTTVIKEVTVGS